MNSTQNRLAYLSTDARRALLAKILREKAGHSEKVLLSYCQQRLWFLDQLESNSCLYNVPLALRLSGRLDSTALQRGLQEIVSRHEVLRTSFALDGERPAQIVGGASEINLPVTTIQESGPEEAEFKIHNLIQQSVRKPFDLSRGPLIRAQLFRIGLENHILLLNLHHIACDTWSLGILLQELLALYQAFSARKPSPLPSLPIQYADFALWQRQQLQGAFLEKQVAYWLHQLEDAPSILELPTDRPRPAIQSYEGAHQSFVLSQDLTQRLKKVSQREGVTLFMSLLSIFKALLYRYTAQKDLVVGTPIANRNRHETEPLIGFFANTLVLRTRLQGSLTFRQLLGNVRKVALDAYDHQDLPFEKLVETLQPERTLSHNPLFQVMLILQNSLPEKLTASGLTMTPMDVHTGTAKFDLTLSFRETSQGLLGGVEYNTDIFEARTIDRLLGHFQTLAEGVLADPMLRIDDLPVLSPREEHRIVVEWNQTRCDFPRDLCLHQLFEAQAERTPNAEALVSQNTRMTYSELNDRSTRLSQSLQKLGAGPDKLVGLCVKSSDAMVIGMLGILKAGGAYLPLDPSYPKTRLGFALEDSRAGIIVTESKLVDQLPPHSAKVLCLDAIEKDAREAPESASIGQARGIPPRAKARPEMNAYVIYTSGSTGKPKGVCVEHRNAVALVSWALQTYTPEELRGVLASTSMCFDLSVFEVFVPLCSGGKVIVTENLLQLSSLHAANEVTLINTVPSVMAEFLRLGGVPDSVRCVNLAGEPLPATLVRQIYDQTNARRVFDLYGPTEDTVYSTAALRDPDGPATIGRPVANEQIYLVDARLQPVPIGVAGELCIGGEGIARGYLNRPQLTAEKFTPNPFSTTPGTRLYRTGDLARFLPDGQIEFLGRKDHQIKLRGHRIELGEIEATLRQHGTVRDCLVTIRESAATEKNLVSYVVLEENEMTDVDALRRFLAERLPSYMIPGAFVFLDAMPRTPNGKLDRRALPAPELALREGPEKSAAPRTATERILADIWSSVLGIKVIGVHDNFFELGGHSLLVTRVISRVSAAFETEVPLRILFEAPTIAELADVIEKTLVCEISELTEEEAQRC